MKYFEIFLLELMATNFSPSLESYVLNKYPSISQWSDTGPSWPSCYFFDWSKLKAFADDKLNIDKMTMSLLERVENTEGKGENTGHQHFLLFPVFSKAFFFGVFESGFCIAEWTLLDQL